jgi:hypothetical protein
MVESQFYNSPYRYYDNPDPATMYNADGTLKSAGGNAAESAVENISSKIPVWGQIIGAASGISHAARSTNTGVGDFIGGAIAPHTQAIDDWTRASKDRDTGSKVKDAFSGIADIALGPIYSGMDSLIQGQKRREAQNRFASQQNYYNHVGYDYALNKDGMQYSPISRPINSVNQANQYPYAQAGVAGAAGLGGNFLKMLLANHKSTSPALSIGAPQGPPQISNPNDFQAGGGGVQFDKGAQADNNFGPLKDMSVAPFTNLFQPTADTASTASIPYDLNTSDLGTATEVTDLGDSSMGFAEGGVAHVKGGDGNDDIALVHADTGKDTGVRVEKGEMIVFSDENVKALQEAIKAGDKDAAFNLLSEQIKKKGEKKDDGTLNHKEGGTVSADGFEMSDEEAVKNVSKLSDAQLAKLYKESTLGEIHGNRKIGSAVSDEFRKRGFTDDYTNGIFGAKIVKKGTNQEIKPDDKFDYFKWRNNKTDENGGVQSNSSTSGAKADANTKAAALGEDYGVFMNASHPIAQAALAAKHSNGAPMAKKTENGVVVLDPDGNPVTKPIGPTENMGYDANGKPLGPETDKNIFDYQHPGISNTTGPHDQDINHKFDLENAGGYGLDAAKIALGNVAANETLPTYQVSPEWLDYAGRVKAQSVFGLPEVDKASAKNDLNNSLITMLERNRQIGGNNAGTIMAGDQAALGQHNRALVQLASADAAAKRANLAAYGPIANQDLAIGRTLYQDQYNKINAAKESGASLAAMAENDLTNRAMFDKFYGPNSDYQKLKDVELERERTAADSEKSGNQVALKSFDKTGAAPNNMYNNPNFYKFMQTYNPANTY